MRFAKIGHATFETPDLEKLIDYYRQVLGLELVDRSKETAALACPSDSISIVLKTGSVPRCCGLTFEIGPLESTAAAAADIQAKGVRTSHRTDADLLPGESIELDDPNGLSVTIVAARPASRRKSPVGISPRKIGHVAFKVANVQKTVDFYTGILGFRVSDWMGDFFAFLRCGPDHHTVNFLRGERPGLHHVAFEVDGWDHIRSSSDFLARQKLPIIWGPGRHGIGHNIFTYHRNADRQIIELYTDLDQISSEDLGYFDPRPWHEDNPQKPKVWDPSLPSNVWGPPIPDGFRDG
jgi:catechol 2,3-dioxygenase-like lactoylglutathione lyase family enzyme